MKRLIETIKLSTSERLSLQAVMTRTGVKNYNVMARWAFVCSLKAKNQYEEIHKDDLGIEISWQVFAGEHDKQYQDLIVYDLLERDMAVTAENAANLMKFHLAKGIRILVSNIKSENDFLNEI